MFLQERQETILQLLQTEGRVLVNDLASKFAVTKDCIRKDLAAMEAAGCLKRVYGGAVALRPNPHRTRLSQRQNQHTAEKDHIARKAYELVHPGDTLFLDISSTNLALAKRLVEGEKKVHVITNMIETMRIFAQPCPLEFTFLGGRFTPGRDGFAGLMTTELLNRFRFDISFLGTVGVDPRQNAVFTYSPEDGCTKKAALAASKRAFLLAEPEKFTLDGNFIYARLQEFEGIISSDFPAHPEISALLQKHETRLY